jgi:hypothetical protein
VSGQTDRRARVLRVRAIEHRAAAARLANADAVIANLSRIAGRLAMLRQSLAAEHGGTFGVSLNAMAEMSLRLEAATVSLVRPINEAESVRAHVETERLSARRREESAAKLHGRALLFDEQLLESRYIANLPFRKRVRTQGECA